MDYVGREALQLLRTKITSSFAKVIIPLVNQLEFDLSRVVQEIPKDTNGMKMDGPLQSNRAWSLVPMLESFGWGQKECWSFCFELIPGLLLCKLVFREPDATRTRGFNTAKGSQAKETSNIN